MSYLNETANKLQLSTISSEMLMTYDFCVYEYTLVGTIYYIDLRNSRQGTYGL